MKLDYRLIYPEKIHSAISALVLCVVLIGLFVFSQPLVMLVLFGFTVVYFLYLGLSVLRFIKISLYTASFTALYLFMVLLFPNVHRAFDISVFIRLFFVSTLSVSSLEVIYGEVILLYLAQHKKCPVMLIYPLLFSLSSIGLFKQKFELYRLNHQLRQTKGWVLPKILFQFLVFTLKFSESGALSLIARGLSENKFYYYDFSIKMR
ncbi:hypothetical protein [Pseudobdellovibrio sp. HCB154]|uniref:hypothetical protein n=1 Tax=Pseudobdellovibrio sp. HCB154 TaxID=3386277 RepID=UPI00391755C4